MVGCPYAALLGSEEGMVNGALCVTLSSVPDAIQEVVTWAMALGHSGFSSCSLPFMGPPCHSAKEEAIPKGTVCIEGDPKARQPHSLRAQGLGRS